MSVYLLIQQTTGAVVIATPRTVLLIASRSNTLSLDGSRSAPALTASRSNSPARDASVSAPQLSARRTNTITLDASE